MESVNLGVMKKKKGVTATPNSALAKTNITNSGFSQGKSRVQGANGVGQGSKGWQSQATSTSGGYGKQINPIIDSLSKAPTYDTPKITESLLTKGGFNQALGVVGARNNAKLKMQNQRVLQGVLGSLVSGDSQNRATANRANIAGMADATDRRGQDMTSTSRANTLAETANRNKMLGKYYDGQNTNGVERNRIANESMLNSKEVVGQEDPAVIQRQRLDAINNGDLKTLYGDNVWASMDDDQRSRAKSEYVGTGRIKDYEADNWFTRKLPFTDAEFRGGVEDEKGTPQQYRGEQPTTQQPKQETVKLDTKQGNALLGAIAEDMNVSLSELSFDDEGNINLPNKKKMDKGVAWEIMNGKV